MIAHFDLGQTPFTRAHELKRGIDAGEITLAGNRRLKIYGSLNCTSGKRMNLQNRVFFKDETEAIAKGYRPCGHCMRVPYQKWKALNLPVAALSKS